MGLFSLGKKKDQGWDEDAATKFHSKAPPADSTPGIVSNISEAKQEIEATSPQTEDASINVTKIDDAQQDNTAKAPEASDSSNTATGDNNEKDKTITPSAEEKNTTSTVPSVNNEEQKIVAAAAEKNAEPSKPTSAGAQLDDAQKNEIVAKTPVDVPNTNTPSTTDQPAKIKVDGMETGTTKNLTFESKALRAIHSKHTDNTAPKVVTKPQAAVEPKSDTVENELFDKSKLDVGRIVASVKLPPQVVADRAAMKTFLHKYTQEVDTANTQGKALESYLFDLLPVVQELNAKLLVRQNERTRLSDKIKSLRSEIEALEENAPEFDKNLRKMVNDLNLELSKDSVEGVLPVDIPKYGPANELVGVISTMGKEYAKMLPALETSKDGALAMLQSLNPESRAYTPTKELVEFSTNGIVCIKRFLKSHVELRNGLQNSLKNYDLISHNYKQTLAESEANLKEITGLVNSIKEVSASFQASGNLLRKIVPTS